MFVILLALAACFATPVPEPEPAEHIEKRSIVLESVDPLVIPSYPYINSPYRTVFTDSYSVVGGFPKLINMNRTMFVILLALAACFATPTPEPEPAENIEKRSLLLETVDPLVMPSYISSPYRTVLTDGYYDSVVEGFPRVVSVI
ncbi:hypothetical protein ACJJTC_007427 [Scirpophaga incertulas]